PSVNELRGPNDVMNMSTLFGLSKEHAKKAISMNCRLKERKLTFETNMKEQNLGNEEASVFQCIRDSNKFSFLDAMEFLPLDCNTKQVTANGIEEQKKSFISVRSDASISHFFNSVNHASKLLTNVVATYACYMRGSLLLE
ncbi:hypothetical protein SUGI_0725580, partial [Cryptomeria japonica]